LPPYALAGVVGAYAAVALLLLGLNLASLWRWQIKGGAIVVTSGLFIGTYVAIVAMLGWPTEDHLPARAIFLATRIVEPEKVTGDPGVIFVWLQGVDKLNLPVGEPRAYKLAYSRTVAEEVVKAQRMRFSGRQVIGNFNYTNERPDPNAQPSGSPGPHAGESSDDKARPGGAGGIASLNQDLRAVFEEMPPLPLPDKVPYNPENDY
jgi:hypothetical protein